MKTKSKKTKGLAYSLVLTGILVNSFCFAQNIVNEGSGTSGGGAEIASQFRLRGTDLINAVEQSPAANALCSAQEMRTGLDGTKIRVVDIIINSETNQPVTDQSLDAWTTPGDMQLLRTSWATFFNPTLPNNARSIDTLVLHEIYRATGKCDDNNFIISDKILKLLKLSNKYEEEYKFNFAYKSGGITFVKNVGWVKALLCATVPTGDIDNVCAIFRENTIQIVSGPIRNNDLDLYKYTTKAIFETKKMRDILNLTSRTDAELPFYIYLDLQTGHGSFGLDPTQLTQF